MVVDWLVDSYDRNFRALNGVVAPSKLGKATYAGHLWQNPYDLYRPALQGQRLPVYELLTVNLEALALSTHHP